MPESSALVFVYNADSDFFSKLTDFAHKVISPKTYACRLCAITHSNFGMKQDWRQFLEKLDLPVEFLYRDELKRDVLLPQVKLPAIFLREDGKTSLLIPALEIREAASLDELKNLILTALEQD